jgi:protein-S-isoprenylcysteine O-methyltransferase Ste14
LLQYTCLAALPFLVLHISVQIRRIQLEEEVLRKAFPDYTAYALRTPCILPGVW